MKRVRSQSQLLPSFCSWLRMVPPYCSFQAQTSLRKSSREKSQRLLPSFLSLRSTTFCVAMPAWSVPGTHTVLNPCIRLRRTSTSWIDSLSACPMCRMPVTFGGGMTMVYGLPPFSGVEWKKPFSRHQAYHLGSMAFGS